MGRELAQYLFFTDLFSYTLYSSPKQLRRTQCTAHIVPCHELTAAEEKVNQVTKWSNFSSSRLRR